MSGKRIVLRGKQLTSLDLSAETPGEVFALDFSMNKIPTIPDVVGEMTQLTQLRAFGNQLRSIPEFIANDKALRIIDIGKNPLDTFPSFIFDLPELREFEFVMTKTKRIPDNVGKAKSLTLLNASTNDLEELPDALRELVKLENIDLSVNRFTVFPKVVCQLKSLTQLVICGNDITNLPTEIGELVNLFKLDIHKNKIQSIPASIGNLKRLQNFQAEYNQITNFPVELGQCEVMKDVSLSYNRISEIPEGVLSHWPNVRKLLLDHNRIKTIPHDVSCLQNLFELDVSDNKIESFPPELAEVPQMGMLRAGRNLLKTFPPVGPGVSELFLEENFIKAIVPPARKEGVENNIRSINLQANQIESLGPELSDFSHLISLDVSFNKLTTVPDSLMEIKSLVVLNFSGNMIASIPPSIGSLTSLQTLLFGYNRLKEIPNEISGCTALQNLHLGGNSIVSVPECLQQLPALKSLYLDNNGIERLPGFSFPSLTLLDLSFNAIGDVTGISAAKNLHDVALNYNAIFDFPNELLSLPSLDYVDLTGNFISDLPSDFSHFTVPKFFSLADNRLVVPNVFESTHSSSAAPPSPSNLPSSPPYGTGPAAISSALSTSPNSPPSPVGALSTSEHPLYPVPSSLNPLSLPPLPLSFSPSTSAESLPAPPLLPTPQQDCESSKRVSLVETVPSICQFCSDIPTKGACVRVDGNAALERFLMTPPPRAAVSSWSENSSGIEGVEIGVSEMCGRRSDMQDAVVYWPRFQGLEGVHLAGVYDGHGGAYAARVLSKRLPSVLSAALTAERTIAGALQRTYAAIDADLAAKGVVDGATAVTLLIVGDTVYAANAGDTRAVLCRKGKAVDLTRDQKPTDASEIQRIRAAGGFVAQNGRVQGELAVCRSIGDPSLKPYVTCEPEITSRKLHPGDEFIIIACDGVWDVLTSQQAVNIARSCPDTGRAAATIRDFAYFLNSGDNISAMVIKINWKSS